MKKSLIILICFAFMALLTAESCNHEPTADEIAQKKQETILQEAARQAGMPDIKNFRNLKIYKAILEMCDQAGLVTYTYLYNELNGKFTYLGQTIGYPIPYATQYTNPQKEEWHSGNSTGHWVTLPQADPDGLFKPSTAEGTWIIMKDPNGSDVHPIYMENRVACFPFKLGASQVMGDQDDKTAVSSQEPIDIKPGKPEDSKKPDAKKDQGKPK